MSRLIESIKLEDGRFHRLPYHQSRMDQSVQVLFQQRNEINLALHLQSVSFPKQGLFKCRMVYDRQIHTLEFLPYAPRYPVSLRVVHDNEIAYQHKFEDRDRINQLLDHRQFCDDILIVKNGMVTDSSYSNIIFFDGDKWITPNTPLLKGTMRQFLLDAAEIKEEPIAIQQLSFFKSFRLINAMLGFDGPEIEVSAIVL